MTLETTFQLVTSVTLVAILGVVICLALLVHGAVQDFRLDVIVESDDDDEAVGADVPMLDEETAARTYASFLSSNGYTATAGPHLTPLPADAEPVIYPSFRSVLDAVDGAREAIRDLVNSDVDLSDAEGNTLLAVHVALGKHALELKGAVAHADQ